MNLRLSAFIVAVPVALLGAVGIWSEPANHWMAHGPIQSGHAEVSCRGCHVESPGTTRQQIQAKLAYVMGRREEPADFGRSEVTSDQCLDCHQRPNERHPIYRFREPRFIEALQQVEADSCLGCHTEHAAARVSSDTRICSACHSDLKLANDPVNVPHITLIKNEKWGTCLGCHDFHGNHSYEPPTHVRDLIPEPEIRAFFGQGPSPYGPFKMFEGKTQ
ncbi:hypothetical protein Q4577_13880 [Marinovum sp. 2_MG-2023]|uniref:hypothetical protein n=1 Tax=unclassified Marinovum TaxID=2647166 RepID=UPI0026E1EDFD|nr:MULTISPECIES: hypothetical protein [unclassified Marinovum]MDO6731119.1 hypothetical protein [Marinovum sp. 2_MG-2023]MDO6778616.1 hypothetical protein [Marinovum sp. 1_MG-2023]